MRITDHPILDFERGNSINFRYNGQTISAYENETIAVALHSAGVRILSRSQKNRTRGLYCAIGNCASCMVIVDGEANIKSCITLVKNGMVVETQTGKGILV